ncbi:MAG: hypothetical protein WAM70_02865 [Pyrinomonadaceae bacterium]
MLTQIAKVVVRGLLGLVVGILAGALICGLAFAAMVLVTGGGNRSLGGIGTITDPVGFSAMIGAILGALYGAMVGSIVGLAGLGTARGCVAGLAIGALIAAYIFFTASDTSLNSALYWIFITGGIIGSATGFLSTLIRKRIKWLSA